MRFRHENYEVWQKSIDFSVQIIEMTKLFPERDKYALGEQLRRAAIAIPSNIAEGCG
jgi:four helix bundle protein